MKDHVSRASFFCKLAGWREQKGRDQICLPNRHSEQEALEPGLGMTKTANRYRLYDGIEAKVAVMFWNGERLHGEEEAFEDGSDSGSEFTERETLGKRSEFQSFSGTKAEREAVGRGDTAAERQSSCSGALRSIDRWRVRGEEREEGRNICNG